MDIAEFIYIIHSVNLCKVGKSTDYEKRFKNLQSSSPEPLAMLRVYKVKDCTLTERELHKLFAHKRSHGEWFNLTLTDLDSVDNYMELNRGKRIIDPRWPELKINQPLGIGSQTINIPIEQDGSIRRLHIGIKRLQNEMSKVERELIRLIALSREEK